MSLGSRRSGGPDLQRLADSLGLGGSRQYTIATPDGDTLTHIIEQGGESITTRLSARNQALYDQANQGVEEVLQQLSATPSQDIERANAIRDQLFGRLSSAINDASSQTTEQTKSDLSQRLGGQYNSTFGNELLSRIESDRLGAIGNAQVDADSTAQQYLDQQQATRYQRLNLLNDQIQRITAPLNSLLPDSMRVGTSERQLSVSARTNLAEIAQRAADASGSRRSSLVGALSYGASRTLPRLLGGFF